MRITNSMTQNMMMLNINKNSRKMFGLYEQQASGKEISLPSQDPIRASRILRFRSNLDENEQYQRNVLQASSWMDVSEQAFNNTLDILKRMRELSVTGANDTLEVSDREKIANEISSLREQLGTEMNSTYAGRYIFSGYRTDREAIFTKDNESEYKIKQKFTFDELENVEAYQKFDKSDSGKMTNADIIKLPYKNSENVEVTINGNGKTVVERSLSDVDAYEPADDEIVYIKETGEIVLGKNIKNELMDNDLEIEYEKKGFFKGELNPTIYFECEDIKPTSKEFGRVFEIDTHKMIYEVGVGVSIDVNSLGKNIFTDKLFADIDSLVDTIMGVTLSRESSLREKYLSEGYIDEDLEKKIEAQIKLEKSQISTVTQNKFSNMLEILDNKISLVSTEHTDLGSRMGRLELIDSRLAENGLTYTDLLSENEDVDYMELTMNLMTAQSIYQASLQTGASLSRLTLLDFVR